MSYRIEGIEGIGPAYARKLAQVKIRTTRDLLEQCSSRKGRRTVGEQTGLSEKLLLKWANLADLMRISGIGTQFSELLEAAGVDTVKELRNRNAANLSTKMQEVNAVRRLARRVPALAVVEGWVEQAQKLAPVITH